LLDFKKLPLDAQLTALLDGETTPEQKQELEQRLANDEGAKRLYDKLRHGADFGKHRLDDVLKEPVPLALVRSIKSAQPPKAPVASRVSRPSFKLAPTGPQALAAAIILFIAGCGIGFFAAGSTSTMQSAPPATIEAAADSSQWLTDVIANQRLIARQPRHIFEVPSTQAEEISTWLTSTVGVAFRVPDLSDQGWTFQGARVFIGDGRPVGQLVYTSSDAIWLPSASARTACPPRPTISKKRSRTRSGWLPGTMPARPMCSSAHRRKRRSASSPCRLRHRSDVRVGRNDAAARMTTPKNSQHCPGRSAAE